MNVDNLVDSPVFDATFPFSTWYRALGLQERLTWAALKAPAGEVGAGARKKLETWREQAPFDQHSQLWQKRLAADGLDDRRLPPLLESPTQPPDPGRGTPEWVAEIASAYGPDGCTRPVDWPERSEHDKWLFLPLVEPLVHEAHRRLVARADDLVQRFPDAPFRPDVAATALLEPLAVLVGPMLNRTLVVELQIARLEERLSGASPEERFRSFIDGLRRPDTAIAILQQYPVLARQVVRRIRQWENAGGELLERLARDVAMLRRQLAPAGELDSLQRTEGAVSDPHRDGRGVYLLGFESGMRLVYKPKSLAVEQRVQELLTWIESRGFEIGFRTLEILDRGDYGWVEFVHPAPCESQGEAARFYRRQGAYVALLYLLDGTDFHHENLIAAGEHPVLVDLETLFHPQTQSKDLSRPEPLQDTVLQSNLLPHRIWGTRSQAGVDLSGLAARSGQMTPEPMLVTAERGTDAMRMERRSLEIQLTENLPRLDGETLSVLDYESDLRQGFREVYGLLLRNRGELIAADGPLAAFADVETRVLLRPTAHYGNLQLESHHPHLQGNEVDRQRFFDKLWTSVPEWPHLEPLVPVETRELARGDVPLFVLRPGQRHLWTSEGDRFENFLPESGLDRVKRRLAGFGAVDQERQEALIRDALLQTRLAEGSTPRPAYDFQIPPDPASRDDLLEAARDAGRRLVGLAFQRHGEAHWLGLDYRDPVGWILVPVSLDLYNGLPGIALALGYLGAVAEDETFTTVARRTLATLRRRLPLEADGIEAIGAVNGWGGPLHALTHLGVLWGDDALLDEAETLVPRIAERVERDENLDLIGGSAGALLTLLELAEHRPGTALLDVARACGDRLIATARPQEIGVGWPIPAAGGMALAGFSHGAAGIALALLRLAAVTGDDRYRKTALAALELERGLLDPEEGNWPDLRAGAPEAAGLDPNEDRFMTAWCHGAPGIAMARLAGLPYLDDPEVRREIDVALANTRSEGFGNNHCLCHGDLGNLHALLLAQEILADREGEEIPHLAAGILAGIDRHGWLFGLPLGIETPGLLVGLAGVAYGLARLADPARVPCVLTLEGPRGPAFQPE